MTTQQKKTRLKNKADRIMQEIGRETYTKCFVCDAPYSCLHHFIPKSRSAYLRYDWENLIPICNKCHCNHHKGDPMVHAIIQEKKGNGWIDELKLKQRKKIKDTVAYWENKITILKSITKV